ncbi:hypothetical protein [Promicromonospora sp. NPDC023987]|uniref:hypothetical protein n=1 Tax=Promicromonospora sp. NPDC023987 TaxID=3155360 RepID=UPI0034117946
MPIKIPIVADVANAVAGVKNIGDEFDKSADSLDKFVDGAKDAERAIEDFGSADSAVKKIDDGVQDASTEVEKLEKKFKDAADAVKKIDGKSLKDVDDSSRKAGEGIDNLKDESNETAREVAASFDGSAESIAEGFQEVAANALGGFGPAGAAAGLAVAAGLGIAIAKLTEVAEKTNEAKEAGAEWAQSFNSAAAEDRITALRDAWAEFGATIVDSKEWYEIGQDEAVSALDAIGNAAKDNEELVADFLAAFNETDPEDRLSDLKDVLADVDSQIADLGPAWKASLGGPDAEEAYIQRKEALEGLQTQTEDQIRVQEQANETERLYAEAMGITVEQYRAYNELSDEAKDAIDNVASGQKGLAIETANANEEIEEQNDLTRDLIGTELDWLDTLDGLKKQVDDNGTSLSRNTAKGRDNLRYILDATDGIDDLYDAVLEETGSQERAAAARDKATDELIREAEAAGFSEREIRQLIDRVNKMPRSKTTDIRADTGSARDSIRDFVNMNPGDVGVGVWADTSQASRDVANWRHRQESWAVSMKLRAV